MNVQYSIVTTYQRPRHLSANLFSQLPMGTMIYTDGGTFGCTDNHLRAWEELAWRDAEIGEDEWSVVLEDDAILCDGFMDQAEFALNNAPSPVVSLYLGQARPPQWQTKAARAVATGQPFIVSTTLLHAVAVAIRTDVLTGPRGMLENASEAAHSPLRKPIDEAITEWCKGQAIPVSYTNPSLVNHDVSIPSVAQHRPEDAVLQDGRVAHNFGTRSRWSRGIAIM